MIWNTEDINPDWPLKPLADLATKVGSGATPRGGRRTYPDRGTPFIRSQNVQFDGFTAEGLAYLTDEQARQLDGVTVQEGDVLLNITGASIGRVCIAPPEMAGARVNQHVCIIRSDAVKASFLAHYLASPQVQDAIFLGNYGVTREALTKGQILDLPVPVPDRDVQDALMKLVDTAIAHRVRAEAHCRAAEQAVKRAQRAVLAAACSGRLTADWREEVELAPVGSLLAEIRRKLARNRRRGGMLPPDESALAELPDTWAWASVGEVAEVKVGGTPSRKVAEYWGDPIPWVSSGEVANCRISVTREKITESGLANSNAKLYPAGTVLIAMIGEGKTRGQAALLDIEAATNQNTAGIHADRSLLDPEYLWRWALAQYEITRGVGRGGNQPALNAQKVRDLTIPIPPLDEQREIVRRVDEMLEINERILVKVDAASSLLDDVGQSVLTKAFRGELIGTSV